MVTDKQLDKLLRKIYYDAKKPSSFSSAKKLYQVLNANGKKAGYHRIRKWLNSQDNYSLLKTPRRSFKRLHVYTTGIGNLYEADLMEIGNISKENDGYRYILVVMDVFSKYAWLQPLKTKTGHEVSTALRKIFQNTNTEKIRTDKDKCFLSKNTQQLFKEKGIRHFVTQNEDVKCNFVERLIRTLRQKFWRFFLTKRSHRIIDDLQSIVQSYNSTIHRTLGIAPENVSSQNEVDLWARMYLTKKKPRARAKEKKPEKKRKYKYKIGALVRISHVKHIFDRSYSQNWTEEVFKIAARFQKQNINLYKLSDINGEEIITGSFYENELQRVHKDQSSLWVVEKIIRKRKRKGKTEYLCKFQGWPDRYNEYVPEENIKNLT